MEINRGVHSIGSENEQEGDFSSKLHEKEKTVWRFEFDSANLFSSNQQPTTNNVIKITTVTSTSSLPPYGDHHYTSKSAAMPLHYSLLYHMMPAEPFR